ncbi:MAG: carbamoyltransferase C-terminal domain-containing protein [Phycisphaerae bacterium]
MAVLVLGIADGQTSGACVVADGRILAAVNEERIVRLKQARGFPRKSITEVLRLAGAAPADIGAVALSDLRMKLREEVDGWPGWFEARAEGRGGINDVFFRAAARFGGLFPYVPGLRTAYYGLRWPIFHRRRKRIPQILRDEFGITAPVRFFHHHFAHAASAYYTCGQRDALVITMDGGGDGHCAHVYSARNGELELLSTTGSYNSLGNYYAYVTAICGYKAKRHEGKITGLAAHGEPVYRELFDSLIGCRNGRLVNRGRVLFNGAVERITSSLPEGWKHEDLAATIQRVAEDVTRAFIGHWVGVTGHRSVALAGGIFANVRINQEILEIPGVDRIFVHPGMADEGLFVGSALAMDRELQVRKGCAYVPADLPHVYLGTDLSELECEQALRRADLEFGRPPDISSHVAGLLAEGKVVARAIGRMEYGPRALGNRTIMYQPNDPSVNDWLNELLKRTEFMPFAPANPYELAGQFYVDHDGALDTARFMTVTMECTPYMREHCAGVVHVDGTARPQLVRREDNPGFYDIIQAYAALTQVPVIINTSFNIHEEPIVRTADDAARAFIESELDHLQLGPFVAVGPVGSQRVREKWKGKSVWGRTTVQSVQ